METLAGSSCRDNRFCFAYRRDPEGIECGGTGHDQLSIGTSIEVSSQSNGWPVDVTRQSSVTVFTGATPPPKVQASRAVAEATVGWQRGRWRQGDRTECS